MPIQIRIFLGYLQNKEMKIHLNQSQQWRVAKELHSLPLVETHWQEEDYIGLFIPPLLTCAQLKEKAEAIKTELQLYCPQFNLERYSPYLFPQLFLL